MANFLRYLGIWTPRTGRMIASDGDTFNQADWMRSDLLNIARGNNPGAEPLGGYGERLAPSAETNRIIWPNGPYGLPPSAGVQMSIVSDSAEDNPGGTGAGTVHILYLDDTLTRQEEFVTMNGLTPVLTVATNIRFIECMHIHNLTGTGTAAAGTITASNSSVTYSQISSGAVRCASSVRMVPAGKVGYVAGAAAGAISATADAGLVARVVADEIVGHVYEDPLIWVPYGSIAIQNTSVPYVFPIPIGPFSAGTVIGLQGTVDKGATIAASWFGWTENA